MAHETEEKKAAAKEGEWVKIPCAFCKGSGRDPFKVLSALSNCPVCGGRGEVLVKTPYETCGACVGTGVYFRSKLYCGTCGGKGVLTVRE